MSPPEYLRYTWPVRGKRARFDDNTLSDGAGLMTAAPDYQTVRRLGVGGMAEVFLAKDRAGKKVVIKRLFEEQARGRKNDEQVTMFLREAKFAGKLQHKNIVRVLDYGKDAMGLFIVMEYLRGYTLRELGLKVWQTGCMIPLETLLAVINEVARGLDYAHNFKDPSGKFKGLIHRDVSPDNIFVCFDGTVKLLDFGIVKPIGSTDVTQAGILKGKFNFMAPELFETGEASPRTDVYALGVTLYLLCTGKNPHSGKEGMQLVRALMDTDPPRAIERNPDLPPEVDRFVMDLISRKPKKRLANCATVQKAIGLLLRGKDPMLPRELIGLVKNQKPLPLPSLRPGARPLVAWDKREANLGLTDPGADDKSDTSIGSDLIVAIDPDADSERTIAATDPGALEQTRIEPHPASGPTIDDPTMLSSGRPATDPPPLAPPPATSEETLVDGPFPAAVLQEAARKYATTELRKKPPPSPVMRYAAVVAAFAVLAVLGVVVGLYVGGGGDEDPVTPGVDIDPNAIVVKERDEPAADPPEEERPTGAAALVGAEEEQAARDKAEKEQADKRAAEQAAADAEAAAEAEAEAEAKAQAERDKADKERADKLAAAEKARSDKAADKAAAEKRAAEKRAADARRAAEARRAADERAAAARRRAADKGRTVKLSGPSRIKWRTANGKTIKTGSGTVQLPDSVKSIVAYDPVWGVKTKVEVSSRIDYDKLPRYPVVVRARPWAEVTIGRKKLGATPFEKPFMLVEGRYTVKLTWNDAKKTLPLEVGGSSKPVIVAADMRQ